VCTLVLLQPVRLVHSIAPASRAMKGMRVNPS
jgi:hypothetical protein